MYQKELESRGRRKNVKKGDENRKKRWNRERIRNKVKERIKEQESQNFE